MNALGGVFVRAMVATLAVVLCLLLIGLVFHAMGASPWPIGR